MPEAPFGGNIDAGVDDRMLALEETLDRVREAMESRMAELLGDLARTARSLYGERVVGASLFLGIAEVTVRDGADELTGDEMAPLREAVALVEESARVLRRNGMADTTSDIVPVDGDFRAEALDLVGRAPDVRPEDCDAPRAGAIQAAPPR